MDQREIDLWRMVDVGGYASMSTLFSFTLKTIEMKIEKDNPDIQKERDRINDSYQKLSKRFQQINLHLLNKNFPLETLHEIKENLIPEMGQKYTELDTLLKHYVSGETHLKIRILNKIKECRDIVKRMSDLGIEFSKSNLYWEYRNTKPQRIYLEGIQQGADE